MIYWLIGLTLLVLVQGCFIILLYENRVVTRSDYDNEAFIKKRTRYLHRLNNALRAREFVE